jgi:transcriptional regulator with XRE-family HTH domain
MVGEAGVTEARHSMQEILLTLGNRVRCLRERKAISQEAFADLCGLHRTAVGLIERGRSIPRLDSLLVISEHLGVAVSELLEGLRH